MTFSLHNRLSRDTHWVADWPVNRVLLMNDANYPWLILVPRYQGLCELHDVPLESQGTLIAEINRAARALKAVTGAVKINTAALGNSVPQLHVHVIARFETDISWPDPIWGKHAAIPYAQREAGLLIERFLSAVR